MKKLKNSVDKFVDKCVYPVENSYGCAKVEKKNLYAQFYQHLQQIYILKGHQTCQYK
jgi:hypothetical protein